MIFHYSNKHYSDRIINRRLLQLIAMLAVFVSNCTMQIESVIKYASITFTLVKLFYFNILLVYICTYITRIQRSR